MIFFIPVLVVDTQLQNQYSFNMTHKILTVTEGRLLGCELHKALQRMHVYVKLDGSILTNNNNLTIH